MMQESRERPASTSYMFTPHTMYLLSVLGALLFLTAAYSYLSESLLYRLDEPLLREMRRSQEDLPETILIAAEAADRGFFIGMIAATVSLCILWLIRRRYRRFSLLSVGMSGEFLMFLGTGALFSRERPELVDTLKVFPLPGFPSGHGMAIVTFFGVLLAICLLRMRSRAARISAVTGAVAVCLLVGALRLFRLAHYLTDIIAGYGLGLLWMLFVLSAVNWIFDRYVPAEYKEEGRRKG